MFCRNCLSLLVATQASCWASNILGSTQKNCSSCYQDSPVTDHSLKMFMAQEVSLVALTKHRIDTPIFISDQYKLFKAGYQANPDALLLHFKFEKDSKCQ